MKFLQNILITNGKSVVKEVKNFTRHTLSKEEINKITGEKVTDNMQKTFTIFRRDGQILTDSQIAVFVEGKMKVYEVGSEIATVLRDIFSSSLSVFVI